MTQIAGRSDGSSSGQRAEAPLFTPHQQVEREFKRWREARGKLYHVSNRADFLMDRERKRKCAAYAAKRAAEGKPVRERTTKRQLDVHVVQNPRLALDTG